MATLEETVAKVTLRGLDRIATHRPARDLPSWASDAQRMIAVLEPSGHVPAGAADERQ